MARRELLHALRLRARRDSITFHTGQYGRSGSLNRRTATYAFPSYGVRMSPYQSAAAAERVACTTSAWIRTQVAPAFASLDVRDAFISVTVAR